MLLVKEEYNLSNTTKYGILSERHISKSELWDHLLKLYDDINAS
jgi:hypothetical protein